MAQNGRVGGYNNGNIPLPPPPSPQLYPWEYGFSSSSPGASWEPGYVPMQQQQFGSGPMYSPPPPPPVAAEQEEQQQQQPISFPSQPNYELDPSMALVSVGPPPPAAGTTSSSSEPPPQQQPGYYLIQRLESLNMMDMPNVEPPGLIPPVEPERLWQQQQHQPLQPPPPAPPRRNMVVPVAPERKHYLKDPLIVNVPVIGPEFYPAPAQAAFNPFGECAPLVPEYVGPPVSPPGPFPAPSQEGIWHPPRPRPSSSSGEGGRQQRNRHGHCRFCSSNGEVWERAASHRLRDPDGKVRCPVLRAHVCPICGATGDVAHTARYCPQRAASQQSEEAAPNTGEEGEQNQPKPGGDERYVHLRSSAGGYTFQKY